MLVFLFWLHYVLQCFVFSFVLSLGTRCNLRHGLGGLVGVVLDGVLMVMLSTIFSGCGCQQELLLLVLEFYLCLFSDRNSGTLMLHVF